MLAAMGFVDLCRLLAKFDTFPWWLCDRGMEDLQASHFELAEKIGTVEKPTTTTATENGAQNQILTMLKLFLVNTKKVLRRNTCFVMAWNIELLMQLGRCGELCSSLRRCAIGRNSSNLAVRMRKVSELSQPHMFDKQMTSLLGGVFFKISERLSLRSAPLSQAPASSSDRRPSLQEVRHTLTHCTTRGLAFLRNGSSFPRNFLIK
eukprot:6481757-Amphidinium_carterae.1